MKKVVLFVLLASLLTGCYLNDEASPNQIAVKLDEGKIVSVEGPGGVYTDMGWFADLLIIDINTLTFSVEDPEVLTQDNQAVGLKITIQARRQSDDASIENIVTNWSSMTNNDRMVEIISATAREGMKNGVRGFKLEGLLNDRDGLAIAITEQLEEDTAKYSVEIVNVTVENVAPSAEYMAILSETANINAETDKEKRRQDLINQAALNSILEAEKQVEIQEAKLLEEQAKTAVQVEIAEREGKIIAASNQVYLNNPAALDLRKHELLAAVYGATDIVVVPSDANLFLNPGGQIVPVQ